MLRVCTKEALQQEGSYRSCPLPMYCRPLRVFQGAVLQALSM